MAASSEELSSQAEILQSSIAFFKMQDSTHQWHPSKREPARPAAKSRPSGPHSSSQSLAKLQHGVKNAGAGVAIELGENTGTQDAQDREFTSY